MTLVAEPKSIADQIDELVAESDALQEEWEQINLDKDGEMRHRVTREQDARNYEIAMANAAISKKIAKLTTQAYEALMA